MEVSDFHNSEAKVIVDQFNSISKNMLTNTLKYFSRVSSSTRLLARNAKFASTSIHHLLNNKNAALITNLPPEITQSALLEKLKDIAKKDVYLQPGCSIHYLDKSKAIVSAEYLSSKGLKVRLI